ncbi:hypothetical protein MTR67_022154 [Solanum verrucosum]|uniref:Uncharacterized protein n=1 Tax=Solanum verrucosum TaxID=315347 RepID=A0AAF0QRB9_SOLVR|nr:hypothetical protein MTR67_022154 [Solanum verrucosum]
MEFGIEVWRMEIFLATQIVNGVDIWIITKAHPVTLFCLVHNFFLEHKEARYCSSILSRSRISGYFICYESRNLVEKDLV